VVFARVRVLVGPAGTVTEFITNISSGVSERLIYRNPYIINADLLNFCLVQGLVKSTLETPSLNEISIDQFTRYTQWAFVSVCYHFHSVVRNCGGLNLI
jgi:hypothetical protein